MLQLSGYQRQSMWRIENNEMAWLMKAKANNIIEAKNGGENVGKRWQ